jgi:hypothetical protein
VRESAGVARLFIEVLDSAHATAAAHSAYTIICTDERGFTVTDAQHDTRDIDPTSPPHSEPEIPITPYEGDRPTRSGCFWGVAGAGGCLLLMAIIVGALILLGVTSVNSVIGSIGSLFGVGSSAPPARAEVITTRTIVQGIQPLGQLVSVSAQLAKADIYVGVGQGALNACGFSANHVAEGAVEAGIELTGIGETDVVFDPVRQVYIVTVPSPQLTSWLRPKPNWC